jgi:hypothetical protein
MFFRLWEHYAHPWTPRESRKHGQRVRPSTESRVPTVLPNALTAEHYSKNPRCQGRIRMASKHRHRPSQKFDYIFCCFEIRCDIFVFHFVALVDRTRKLARGEALRSLGDERSEIQARREIEKVGGWRSDCATTQ